MLMPIFFLRGGGGGGVNKVHYGLCEDGESKNLSHLNACIRIHPVCVNFEKHYSFIIHTRGTNY